MIVNDLPIDRYGRTAAMTDERRAARLATARLAAGHKTAADAARYLGMKYATYAGHENASSGFRSTSAEVYARKFKVSLDWLLTGRGTMAGERVAPAEIEVAGLPVLGSVQAGHWLETNFIDSEDEPEMLPVARDSRFPRARQYALRVVGDSMDLDYPDGSYVTCVDFAESGLAIRSGLVVHVVRLRSAGQLAEITLKRVGRAGDQWTLEPRSSNPNWQTITLQGGDDVQIRGVVTGGWRRTEIPR